VTRYSIDRSIINEALALAEQYVSENASADLPEDIRAKEELRAREKAAVEMPVSMLKARLKKG
jgi:hypothetical protein